MSEKVVISKLSSSTQFSDDVHTCDAIKSGEWRTLFDGRSYLSPNDLLETVSLHYCLDSHVADRLEVSVSSYIGNAGNTKMIVLEGNFNIHEQTYRNEKNKNLPEEFIPLSALVLKVRMAEGDMIEKDISCDSNYMMAAIDRVGKALRQKMWWVKIDEEIFLIMDNAGGHGRNDIIEQYTLNLKTRYNVTIIHQVPRSPYCNALDLGVWCSLQASVEKTHYMRRCNTEALVRSVYETWRTVDMSSVINNVFTKLHNIICLINDGDGGNDLVEVKRGPSNAGMKFDFEANKIKIEMLVKGEDNVDSESDEETMEL